MGDKPLRDRVSLITGASRGIGRAIALQLAASGSDVALVARQVEPLGEVASTCEALGVRAHVARLDIADSDAVRRGVESILEKTGRIDHLVNNAGVVGDGLFLRMKREQWDRVIQVNLGGAFDVTRAVLPSMVKARYGRIVNISSVVALMGNPGQANYCAAKAGLIGMTKSLAREVASRKITVNAVAPGFIETDMTRDLSAEARQKMASLIPLDRLGTPDDIAAAVDFLIGPGGSYITGEVLNVSGGLYM